LRRRKSLRKSWQRGEKIIKEDSLDGEETNT
jgi:hypothetical protein